MVQAANLTQEELERARVLLEREEQRKVRSKEYRERRKDNPQAVAKQKAYNEQRRGKEKVKRQAMLVLVDRHREEFEEILAGL